MKSYQNMIHRIVDIICENSSDGQNYILIGDNSTGKSDILRKVTERKSKGAVYFIDSVNRTFDAGRVELVGESYKNLKLDSQRIVLERISLFNYNQRDTFCVPSYIEQIFAKYSSEVYTLCKIFLGHELEIVQEKLEAGVVENQVILDGNAAKLSSGYQAVMRLFTEILYFCDVMSEKKWDHGFVIIDELDEYLSPRNSSMIFNFLQERFPKLNFLITTHSLDMVASARNSDLILLNESDYEIYAESELGNTVDVDRIFSKLFFKDKSIHQSSDDSIDEKLRTLLNMKIAGLWDEAAQIEFQKMGNGHMQPHQKMIYRQIEEW